MARSLRDTLTRAFRRLGVAGGTPDPYKSAWRFDFRNVRSTENNQLPIELLGIREMDERLNEFGERIPEQMRYSVIRAMQSYFDSFQCGCEGENECLHSSFDKMRHGVQLTFDDVVLFVPPEMQENHIVRIYLHLEVRWMHLMRMSVDELLEIDKKAYAFLRRGTV